MYCDDNRDFLPDLEGTAFWCWDIPTPAANSMLNSGCTKKTFFCPSTAPRFTDYENFAGTPNLWTFALSGGYNIAGYSFAFWGGACKVDSFYQNQKLLPEQHLSLTPPIQMVLDDVASREVVADAILSKQPSLPASGADDFIDFKGSFPIHHTSAHIQNTLPAGSNIAYKDGHVQWRKFNASNSSANGNETKVRNGDYADGVNTPYFWW